MSMVNGIFHILPHKSYSLFLNFICFYLVFATPLPR
uniref:Uncharacterized protein n=1 Tax=Anguilla anguilla TaxID=7936 RepID=A0A0E9PFL1_ANGAN